MSHTFNNILGLLCGSYILYDVMFKILINTYKIKFPLFKNYHINKVKYYSYS
jgi:hypothetical protein